MTKELSVDGRIMSDYFLLKFILKISFLITIYFPNKKKISKFVQIYSQFNLLVLQL